MEFLGFFLELGETSFSVLVDRVFGDFTLYEFGISQVPQKAGWQRNRHRNMEEVFIHC
jgi:hypothetical protein